MVKKPTVVQNEPHKRKKMRFNDFEGGEHDFWFLPLGFLMFKVNILHMPLWLGW